MVALMVSTKFVVVAATEMVSADVAEANTVVEEVIEEADVEATEVIVLVEEKLDFVGVDEVDVAAAKVHKVIRSIPSLRNG